MDLDGIIIEGSPEDKYRLTKAIERLPEDTIINIKREKGDNYLKATINREDDSIINLQCLEKKATVNVPKEAKMVKHNLKSGSEIAFFYIKTFYKILYPK